MIFIMALMAPALAAAAPDVPSGAVFVSDLEWVSSFSALADSYPVTRDVNIDHANNDKRIIINGVHFEKGIGMHTSGAGTTTESTVVVNISGKGFGEFGAWVGVDGNPSVSVNPDVFLEYKVIVDGKELFVSDPLNKSNETLFIKVAIPSGAKELTLSVANHQTCSAGTWADWGNAYLLARASGGGSAQTSDSAMILAAFCLLAISAAGIFVISPKKAKAAK